jgi:tetratricopeptide (TPR) repeat protein
MSRTHDALTELFRRYLSEQAAAQAEGLGYAEPSDEVTPYDAGPVQPVDPKVAWDEALAAARLLGPDLPAKAWKVVPEWPALVAGQEPAVALAFAVGNFPQLVRDLHPLLSGGDLTGLRPRPGRAAEAPALVQRAAAAQDGPALLLAAGALRLARRFDEADDALHRAKALPAEWQALVANEAAALAWHLGDAERAAALWAGQPDSAPVLFNRGMAALFLGRPADARASLTKAVALLPESGAWHHLGQLYLALAATRG